MCHLRNTWKNGCIIRHGEDYVIVAHIQQMFYLLTVLLVCVYLSLNQVCIFSQT